MLTTKDVPFILESMYSLRREMVPCFIGAPGIGKTQGIYDFAKSKGVKVVTFILSNTVPSEVSGIRMPDTESKKLEVFDDARMSSLEDGDILFFDEILEAPPMLWSAILTLVQDRIMASGKMLPDVMIVAASNQVAAPSVVPPSTRDRFMWCELRFDFDSWCRWFEKRYAKPIPIRLKGMIKDDSEGYNILTPRRFCKLWEYHQIKGADRIISSMFNETLTGIFCEMDKLSLKQKVDGKRIHDELEMRGFNVPDEWQDYDIHQIFDAIKKLGSEGDKIIEALKGVEV